MDVPAFSLLRAPDDINIAASDESLVECFHSSCIFQLAMPDHLKEFAVRARNDFLACFAQKTIQEPCSDLQFLVQFLRYIAGREDAATAMTSEVFSKVVEKLGNEHLRGKDIHTRAAELSADSGLSSKQEVIRSYYEAMYLMGRGAGSRVPQLFATSHPSEQRPIFTVFGGQGNTQHYFEEFRDLYATYGRLLDDILDYASIIFDQLLCDETTIDQYPNGMDFLTWLRKPDSTPEREYLLSAPVSFPLIALGQLTSFYVTCKIWQLTPGEVVDKLHGSTGHSQGIIVAAGIATCKTWDDFEGAFRSCLIALFYTGCRSQQQFPRKTSWQKMVQGPVPSSEDEPSPMMNIMLLPQADVELQIHSFNRHLPEDQKIAIALINGPHNIVVGGPPESLRSFNSWLQKLRKPQANGEQYKWKSFTTRYLPISAPFHTFYLADTKSIIVNDMERHNIMIKPSDLLIPVYDSRTGRDLREVEEEALFPILTNAITTEMVDWPRATMFPNRSCIIDFGPGETSGVGILLHRTKEGTGTRVILAGPLQGALPHVGYKPDLFESPSPTSTQRSTDWLRDFAPTLLSDASGRTMVSTKMSQLLGVPPLMVAGMTPTTVHPDFVAAVINAGYHVELAAGGYHHEESLVQAIKSIERSIPAGKGITINLIYSAPRSIQWQIPLVKDLIEKGHLIDGITLGAGVPSLEVATGYIEDLGLKHISFKPGSVEAIKQVIVLAKAHPGFPILLQWTGGRGGGHHSAEDFHEPILQTYASIRRCPNIILVAGSGFGGVDDTYPYMTGSWSEKFGQPCMPFDGCLFGSRMMIAKEAHTSLAAKQAISSTEGVEDAFWKSSKGIITVKSEIGQPIHKIATRGVQLWAEMDRKIFSLDKSKQLIEINRQRSYIIERLNKDFQKVWFGYDFTSGKPVELKDMSYADVARRMLELLYIKKRSQWIDSSYVTLFGDFIRRIEERLPLSNSELSQPIFSSYADFNDPFEALRNLAQAYRGSQVQLVNQEDQEYFLSICRRSGQKPAPFIPVLDENFETWFKKDSLWQSEFVEAVVDEDVQRTCILQGPVAVSYAMPENINEPVRVILDRINDGHVQKILRDSYGGQPETVPFVEFFGHHASESTTCQDNIQITTGPSSATYSIPSDIEDLPLPEAWFNLLAGNKLSWRYAVFRSLTVMNGNQMVPNPIRQAFAPAQGCSVMITDKLRHNYVSITMSNNNISSKTDISIATEPGNKIILRMFCYDNALNEPLPLEFRFSYHPESPHSLLHEDIEGRDERICNFYRKLWIGKSHKTPLPAGKLTYKTNGGEMVIRQGLVEKFLQTIGGGMRNMDRDGLVPMDFAIVVGWKAIMKALLLVQGDLLKLVHLSNKFRMYPGARPLRVGEKAESFARTTAVTIQDSGKVVEICCTVSRDRVPVMDVISQFLYRGTYSDYSESFQAFSEDTRQIEFSSPSQASLLISKEWITFHHPVTPETLCDKTLAFELETFSALKSRSLHSRIRTVGKVFANSPLVRDPIEIGTVHYDSLASPTPTLVDNPVIGYLDRHGKVVQQRVMLESPISLNHEDEGFVFAAPNSNFEYSRISQDYNPIHVSPAFARYAGLPGPITHGMHTSAIIRSICEMRCAEGNLNAMRTFSASFSGMIQAGDKIEVHLAQIAMVEGRRVISIEARNVATSEKVFVGECEIEQTETAYIFTGQGSQEVNMGMDLYETSAVAKQVWDRADKHFDETYGISYEILNGLERS